MKINYLHFINSVILASAMILPVSAQNFDPIGADEFAFEDTDGPWMEQTLNDLAPPKDENLVELDIDHPPIGFKVFVDTSSITVGEKDAVVRYWLVLKAGKSTNAMYEGMKCNTREYKTYGYENKWKKDKVNIDKNAQWLPVQLGGHNHFRFELYKYFFCSGVLPRPVGDILDIIAGYKSTTGDYDPTFHYEQ